MLTDMLTFCSNHMNAAIGFAVPFAKCFQFLIFGQIGDTFKLHGTAKQIIIYLLHLFETVATDENEEKNCYFATNNSTTHLALFEFRARKVLARA